MNTFDYRFRKIQFRQLMDTFLYLIVLELVIIIEQRHEQLILSIAVSL